MKYIDLGLPSKTWWADEDLMENSETHQHACVFSIPTKEQFEELEKHCEWKLINNKYFKGFKVIGPNTAFILIPFENIYNKVSRYWLKDEYNSSQGWYYCINVVGPSLSYWSKTALQRIRTVYKQK